MRNALKYTIAQCVDEKSDKTVKSKKVPLQG